MDTGLECGYMEKETWFKLDKYIEQTIKMINGYIQIFGKSKARTIG